MIVDALAKGSISREALQAVVNGTLSILHKFKVWPTYASGTFARPRLASATSFFAHSPPFRLKRAR
eukprot:10269661-Lingulodinium_polyedra.AAC.1